jgi:hypothetical protein
VMCVLCVVIIITKEVLRAKGVLGEKKGRNLQPNHERHVLFVVRHLIFFSPFIYLFFFLLLLNHDIIFSSLQNKMSCVPKRKRWIEYKEEVNE